MFTEDFRKYAPATQRNRQPIADILLSIVPPQGTILEIASGTGEHAVFFASLVSPCRWLPSEPNAELRQSINSWRQSQPAANLLVARNIDVLKLDWEKAIEDIKDLVAVVNINMIHISPWKACQGLIKGAGKVLQSGGFLYLYGPYKQGGKHTASSNESFDQFLKSQNPLWGVRNLEDVIEVAQTEGFDCQKVINMPANNLSVILTKRP